MKIGSFIKGRDNNYNFVRHVAAAMVIFTHSYGLTGHGLNEPLMHLIGQSFSYFAVNSFFVLSGFLITASWLNSESPSIFIASRITRIFPALWVCVFLCLFVVGPLFTNLSLQDYFSGRDFFVFAAENSTLLLRGVYHYLPGVFTNPAIFLDHSVNVSLWTLPIELKMYLAVLLLGLIGMFRFPKVVVFLYAILVSVHWFSVSDSELYRLGAYFAGGMIFYLYRNQIPLSYKIAALLLVFNAAGYWFSRVVGSDIQTIVLPYLVLTLAYLPKGFIRQFNQMGDYSYGLYIFAFPIQQILINVGIRDTALHIVLSYFLTLMVAVLSWHFIESPALKKRGEVASFFKDGAEQVKRGIVNLRRR